MITELIGYVGGIFIMVSFIPQVIKSWKTKKVKDVSFLMIVATLIGTIFWIIYGFLFASMPIIIMNIAFGVLVVIELVLKIKHDK